MQRKYLGIDFTRLLAASMVAAYHLSFFWWLPQNDDRPDLYAGLASIRPFTSVGWVGVEIFFVISGFVIALSAQGRTAREFFIGRALRLYPAAWVCGVISFLVAGSAVGWSEFLRSMVLWPVGPWVDGAYWTIAIEMTFYALVGLVLAFGGSPAIARLTLGLGLYSTAFWIAKAVNSALQGPMDGAFAAIENEVGFLLLLHFGCYFAFGMALSARNLLQSTLFGLVCLVSVLVRSHAIQPTLGPGSAHWIFPPIVWLVATLIIVGSVVWNDWVTKHFSRWASAISVGGLLTYPVYLVHDQLGKSVVAAVSLPPYLAFATGMLCVFIAAYLALLAERRIRSVLRARLLGQSKPTPQDLAVPRRAQDPNGPSD